jgi:hypothetical protein
MKQDVVVVDVRCDPLGVLALLRLLLLSEELRERLKRGRAGAGHNQDNWKEGGGGRGKGKRDRVWKNIGGFIKHGNMQV